LVPIQNGGELAVLYCFIYLYLSAAGPGPISVDRLIRRAKK
jgi:putative oxidoreductase